MAAGKHHNQRSWKNYLLNKRYQLRFTLFMTGLSALLMGLLGWWVKTEARKATEIAINNVYGSADLQHCTRPELGKFGVRAPVPTGAEGGPDDPLGDGPSSENAQLEDEARAQGEGEDVGDVTRIVLGDIESDIQPAEAAPAAIASDEVAAYYECRMEQAIELSGLVGPIHRGERQITIVLALTGLLLLIGITMYGIVMTHRVAGPLYKISLYLNKLRDGRYDTVYNLRKGDQLIEFYEQFKRAHAGLRSMQEEDLARLREVVDIADREGLANASAELAETIEAMRALVAEKETSLG